MKGVIIMPLSMAQSGHELFIKKISGKDDTKKFLNNLGFVEGASIHVVSELNGNIIVNIKGSRIALDKSMANRIHVV
jgi:ferrous iron transport protein A